MENRQVINIIKKQFPNQEFIPLHAPIFIGNEKKYVNDAIDSTYVSSVGAYVDKFESMMCETTGAKHAIAIVNGTNALHLALILAGVEANDEVISQSLTFIATCNAINYIGAHPLFVDVDIDTMGMSPDSILFFLENYCEIKEDGFTYNKLSKRRIKACVPMHTFGLPCRIDLIEEICNKYNIILIEDAAESIGSKYKGIHTGNFGKLGTFSFNGNKTITCGGGGAIITNDSDLAKKAKHLSTQAKMPHKWEFVHDSIGYNYRMPNLNAALACAQLEMLDKFVENKRELHKEYQNSISGVQIKLVSEIDEAFSNYWLNAIILNSKEERDLFLSETNSNGVMSRPVWELMHRLEMFKNSQKGNLDNSIWLAERLVNIPSSVRL